MEIDDTTTHSWADLPKELLEMISKRLDSLIDVYRFRVVCMSWRSPISVFYKQFPRSFFDGERRAWNDELQNLSADAEYPVRYLPIFRAKTISIRVYKLDEEWE
ncbi:hypothetical protein OIU77_019113 [Salix suchowensis]|uniref:F-box domain-containing protein n=1 Tax=Salix suchowensis TaxID=1278906 RepID=A0ABQ9CF38_9ROSI|nr:hypothetical protein OIU77_019113 [Salix suchowensis]